MTAARFNGSPGRTPKGGVRRRVVQAKIPVGVHDALVQVAEQSEVAMTDLGAYYLIDGWNAARIKQGLEPIPMPAYLEQAVRRAAGAAGIQDVLEESLLKVS